ncbi:MAG: RHS repeat-associated core domain-containing protein, partial [Lachnospiraceae bacterium]|nr:RHS repeat-associated core domain-containing protein [Lachnospiraceae bacterium]
TRFTYDRRGNLTEESRGTSRRCAYTYDTAGRMVTGREEVSGEESRYRYNALGMRLDHWLTRQGGSGGPDNWGGRTLHKEYVPDWLSPTAEDLYSDQQGRCRTRALYGRGYACLSLKVSELGSLQGAVPDKGWFGPDRLGSPLVAAHSSGRLLGTGERDPWGELEDPGRAWDYIPGMEEAMGFTSYQYDPVVRKHFAKARFYDGERGRMVSRDPVKEGLNPYLYCGDDPVNRTDPTGEISILAGGLAGGLLGGGAGFVGSLISQVSSGEKFSLREALGSAAEGAVTGAVKGALLSTGVGLVPSLGAEFLGGAAGSALGQWIRGGKADLGESLVDGLGNALSGWAYGSGSIKSLGNAVFRGARAGAVYALIHHEPEKPGLGTGSWGLEGYSLKEGAAPVFSPYIKDRDIRTRCMVPGAWAGSLGCQKAEGYQYGTGQAGSRSRSNGFGRLFKEVALGALLGGLSSAAFYGAGKALEVLKRSVGGESG